MSRCTAVLSVARARLFLAATVAAPAAAGVMGELIMDWKLELVGIPVSDIDRAKAFYTEQVGFTADHDHRVSDTLRFVQLTPPGSVQSMQLVVSDIEAAHAHLASRGVAVSDVQHFDWGSFVFFRDPDGNGWSVQQLPTRE